MTTQLLPLVTRLTRFAPPTVQVPGGYLAAWDFTAPSTSPRNVVANSVASLAVSPNLFDKQRYSNLDNISGTTVTENYAAGPDGKAYAARVVGVGNFSSSFSLADTVDTCTTAFNIKSNTGVSQDVKFGYSGVESVITATTSWTRVTPLTGTGNVFLKSFDGATGCDILIDYVSQVKGSSDISVSLLQKVGHMYFPYAASIFSAEGVNISGTGNYGTAQFDTSPLANGSFCLMMLMRRTSSATGGNGVFGPLNTALNTKFGALINGPNFYYNDQDVGLPNRVGAGADPNGQQAWFVVDGRQQLYAWQYDASTSTASLWVDGVQIRKQIITILPPTIAEFITSFGGSAIPAILRKCYFYGRALVSVEHELAATALCGRSNSAGVPAGVARFICAEGHSIPYGTGASGGPYPLLAQPLMALPTYLIDNAVGGASLDETVADGGDNGGDSIVGRQAEQLALIHKFRRSGLLILSLMIGANDYAFTYPTLSGYSQDPTGFANAVGAILLARKNSGFNKIVLETILPRYEAGAPATLTGFNAWANTVNALFKSAGFQSTYGVDHVIDYSTVTQTLDPSNVTYYLDGTHPTNALHALLAVKYAADMDTIV